jgi:thiol:disulfide interchange protein DsbA
MKKWWLSLMVLGLVACSQKADGPHVVLADPLPTQSPTVYEFFGYFCPHCFHLEPQVRGWRKSLPKSVRFVRVPVSFGRPQGKVLMRAYYLGEMLGILDKSHDAVFKAIHVERRNLSSDADLKALFLELGVREADFDKALADPALAQRVEEAEDLAARWRIDSVPTFVVNGRFKTHAGLTGDVRSLFQEVNRLLRKP